MERRRTKGVRRRGVAGPRLNQRSELMHVEGAHEEVVLSTSEVLKRTRKEAASRSAPRAGHAPQIGSMTS
jgi:hypothetical protein